MSFKLAASNYVGSQEAQAAQILGNLKYFATLTPPVTVAAIRTDYETGQPQAFANDAWDSFIAAVGTVDLDKSTLTVAERAILNTLIEYISPPPKNGCCEIGGSVTPSAADGYYTFNDFWRTGSTAPYQYEFECIFNKIYRCDIETLEVVFTPVGLAPAVTSASPSILTSNGCNNNSDRVMSYIWVEFGSNPSGFSYNLSLDFKDGNGISVASFSPAAAHTFT